MTRRTRVAVDLLYYTGHRGGTETYARGLYRAMPGEAEDMDFVGITNRELGPSSPDWFPGEVVTLPVRGANRVAWAAAESCVVAEVARRTGADLLHCPANFGPLVRRLPTVVTVHDLLAHDMPTHAGRVGRVVGALSGRAARSATRVLTDSAASADSIERHLSLPSTRVDVVPLAASSPPPTAPVLPPGVVPGGRTLVLSTGNRLPHKNFETLVRAWARLPLTDRPLLVLTGGGGRDPLAPLVAELGLDRDVVLLGWVEAAELEGLYAAAALYVCPSLFEGFGLPVLEAMMRGVPVLASDIPVLHEVGAGAAAYVDARDPDRMAAAVSEQIRLGRSASRVQAGRDRARGFAWSRTAALTATSFRHALEDAGRAR